MATPNAAWLIAKIIDERRSVSPSAFIDASIPYGKSTTNNVPSKAPSREPMPPMITVATYWIVTNSGKASAETKPR